MSPLTTTAASAAARPAPETPTAGAVPARGPRAVWLLAAVVVLALVTAASLAIGARGLALDTVWQALTQFDPANGDHAVVHARIPRTVLGLLAGGALGLAGAAMQGVARNPLADPGIIGINAGAALAVVTGIYVFGVASLTGYIWFAFLGAAAAAVAGLPDRVARQGRCDAGEARPRGRGPERGALFADERHPGLQPGHPGPLPVLAGRRDRRPRLVRDPPGPAVPRCWEPRLCSPPAGSSTTSPSATTSPAAWASAWAWSAASPPSGIVLLCGSATALAGPIGFVGLVIPHAVRFLTGPDYRWILPFSLVLAPALLLAADVVGRVILLPGEVPAGIMTALIGAPVFVWLVRRGKGAGL